MNEHRIPHNPSAHVFSALGDPTRLAILSELRQGPRPVGEIVRAFDLAGPTITRHLDTLEQAGLIRRTRKAKERICSLDQHGFHAVERWLTEFETFWTTSFDNLNALLTKDTKP